VTFGKPLVDRKATGTGEKASFPVELGKTYLVEVGEGRAANQTYEKLATTSTRFLKSRWRTKICSGCERMGPDPAAGSWPPLNWLKKRLLCPGFAVLVHFLKSGTRHPPCPAVHKLRGVG